MIFHDTEMKLHNQGCQHCVSKKSGNFAKCLTGGASWVGALFPFLFRITEIFCKIKSKFLNSRVLAGGFVMCKRGLVFKRIENVVEKSAI